MQTPKSSTLVTDRMRLGYALWFTMAFLIAIWGVYVLNETCSLVGENTACILDPLTACVASSHIPSCMEIGDTCGTTP